MRSFHNSSFDPQTLLLLTAKGNEIRPPLPAALGKQQNVMPITEVLALF